MIEKFINYSLHQLSISKNVLIPTRNGPYDTEENVWRALSHEIVFLFKVKSNHQKLIGLISELKVQLEKNDFYLHLNNSEDPSNGVIGIAWLNEGLVASYLTTKNPFFKEAIISINKSLKFNKREQLWHRPNNGRIDQTINHQIWYAYSLSLIYSELGEKEAFSDYDKQVKQFLDNLSPKLHIYKDGVMHHRSLKHFDKRSFLRSLFTTTEDKIIRDTQLVLKSIGYFPFVLLPLLYMKKKYINNLFFKSVKWDKMVNSLRNTFVISQLKTENIYGTHYNLSIYELAAIEKEINETLINEVDLRNQLNIIKKQKGEMKNILLLKSYELIFFNPWNHW